MRLRQPLSALAVATLSLGVAGCRQDMHDAPRYEAYEQNDFFPDKRAMRPPVEGAIARGHLREDTALYTGKAGAAFLVTSPVPITGDLVRRGQQRYNIYCAPCHGLSGRGDGMIVRRGYRQPPSFHIDRLRQQPPGYFFDVITNGFGTMPDYAAQVAVPDRWAIASYLRALQLSQNATVADVPADRRAELDAPPAVPHAGAHGSGTAEPQAITPADRPVPGASLPPGQGESHR